MDLELKAKTPLHIKMNIKKNEISMIRSIWIEHFTMLNNNLSTDLKSIQTFHLILLHKKLFLQYDLIK